MTTPVASTLLAADYHLDAPLPAGLYAGEALIVEVTLRNTGRAPWLTGGAHPVRLGYRWLNRRGEPVVADGGRALLPAPVPPGMAARAEIRVESPPEPGSYALEVELLEEGVAWFSQRGVGPQRQGVAGAPTPAVCAVPPPPHPRTTLSFRAKREISLW
jgi:hypothetical protein